MRPKPSPAFTASHSFHRFLLHFGQREHFSSFPNSCDTRRRGGGDVEDKQGWTDGEREREGGRAEKRKCR